MKNNRMCVIIKPYQKGSGLFMKLSLFKNDKSTVKDEIILSFIVLGFIAAGILLIIARPSFWLIRESDTAVLGMLLTLAGVMYIPGLLYRFMTNDK